MTTRRMFCWKLMSTVIVALTVCPSVLADTIKVKSGDDLQAAIDGAADGDTILVRKGTYGPIALTNRHNLLIKGKGRPVINASSASNGILLTNCTGLSILGFVVTDSQGSGVLADGCASVTIARCRVLHSGDEGIEVANGENITIERNLIDTTLDDGIALSDGPGDPTHNSTITHNRILHAPDGGIDLNGDNNVVTKNLIKDSDVNGVLVASGSGNAVSRNRVIRIHGTGIVLEADNTTLEKNRVLKATNHGIDVAGNNNTLTKNGVVKAGDVGVTVSGLSNQVTQNRIGKSGTVDLQDTTGGDTNTYIGNKVKSTDPPDLPNPKN